MVVSGKAEALPSTGTESVFVAPPLPPAPDVAKHF